MVIYPNPKINIGLDVIRRRPDGFHDLESLFVPYAGMRDVLAIEPSDRLEVEILLPSEGGFRLMDGSAAGDWNPLDDLTVKAWRLLKKDFDLPPVRIHLEKNIPVGAGLGGGSADASFALRLLSEMFDLYLPDAMLEIYAAELGSDCPFFVYNVPMFVSGRGDILERMDVPALEDYEIKVVVPQGLSVSTKEAYAGIKPALPATGLRDRLRLPVGEWRNCIGNDFEAGVFALHPGLVVIKDRLYAEGAVYASMSGSGSSVFGLFRK